MKILITLLSVVNIAFAQVPTTSVSNFSLDYSDPSGIAEADHLIVAGYSFENSPRFTVEQQAGNFVLETANEVLTIKDSPELLTQLKNVKIEDLDLETNTSKIYLSVNQITGNNVDTNIDVKSLMIDCKYEHLSADLKDEVLNSCINNIGKIKIGKFVNNGKNVVSNANLRFNKNRLNFEIRAGGHNINGYGKAYYTPGLLRIRIDKAKVGILNVRNKLFKELEQSESESVRVSNPWIEIDL